MHLDPSEGVLETQRMPQIIVRVKASCAKADARKTTGRDQHREVYYVRVVRCGFGREGEARHRDPSDLRQGEEHHDAEVLALAVEEACGYSRAVSHK